jgi:O-acetyl-ADP-ribose deacetylase (regulator of RNase III)
MKILASLTQPSIYGYPLKLAANVPITSVRAAMAEVPTIREVTFCCYSTGGLAVYQELPI